MATNNDIYTQLNELEISFPNEKSKKFGLNQFSSFLSDKKFLPKSDVIAKDFKNDLDGKTINKKNEKLSTTSVNSKYGYDTQFKDIYSGNDTKPNEFGSDPYSTFNNKYMFLGLNQAYRSDNKLDGWLNFHDKEAGKHSAQMLRLRLVLNDLDYYGCYITDIFKNFVNSNGKDVINSEQGDKDSKEFKNSAEILAEEISIVNPKQIVIFGSDAFNAFTEMANMNFFKDNQTAVKNAIQTTHYSSQSDQAYTEWFNVKRPELSEKLSK
ncbi:uracil-DNA glycosylase family protein [Companilactobacillus sp. HBUAS59544]|uniref:uracil-DNA glycosylase family protein n=1 Tax=Companilactobacillus sp. HBUAS59544 TaxID=3109363 RepID=UPI002FF2ACDB